MGDADTDLCVREGEQSCTAYRAQQSVKGKTAKAQLWPVGNGGGARGKLMDVVDGQQCQQRQLSHVCTKAPIQQSMRSCHSQP